MSFLHSKELSIGLHFHSAEFTKHSHILNFKCILLFLFHILQASAAVHFLHVFPVIISSKFLVCLIVLYNFSSSFLPQNVFLIQTLNNKHFTWCIILVLVPLKLPYKLWSIHVEIWSIPSSVSLSYDRPIASSKANSPQSAIQCLRFQFLLSSLFLKVIQ
jgi:hypothetical protein